MLYIEFPGRGSPRKSPLTLLDTSTKARDKESNYNNPVPSLLGAILVVSSTRGDCSYVTRFDRCVTDLDVACSWSGKDQSKVFGEGRGKSVAFDKKHARMDQAYTGGTWVICLMFASSLGF